VADMSSETANAPVVIKKYANRRLYNTASSVYVTLDDLARMVRENVDFVVYDAKTNEDLTRQILTQIIFEEESRGEALLPVQFLRQLIGFYGGPVQSMVPSYLEMSLDAFARQQEQMRGQLQKAFGATPGAGLIDEAVKRNVALFNEAMKAWPGFGAMAAVKPAPPPPEPRPDEDPLAEMRRQMDQMRDQLDKLSRS